MGEIVGPAIDITEAIRTGGVLLILVLLVFALLSGKFVVPRWAYDDLKAQNEELKDTLAQRNQTATEATTLTRQVVEVAQQTLPAGYRSYTDEELDDMRRDIAALKRRRGTGDRG